RNFISSVENADKIRKLSGTLSTMMDDYFQALKQSKGTISLPVDGYSVTYDKLNKLTWLTGNDFKIRLQEAASGFQSLIPMMIVSNYLLNQLIENKGENALNLKSVEERERISKNIQKILKDKELDDSIRLELIKQYQTELYNHRFINIVEEPEQNLFPKSQRNVLNELLRINNSIKGNLFIFTTHSPYIINYLTLAVKAGILYHDLSGMSEAKEKIEKVVPNQSAVFSEDVVIYQLTEDGEIVSLPKYENLPSDDNFLNNSLSESNQLFEHLLEIEDEYKTC
ncbi:MAG: ATP-binding protein, partial [Verrucomicrobia bacterium]|nr:ATP-binding protein [Verrucomicrobiota bacterium]